MEYRVHQSIAYLKERLELRNNQTVKYTADPEQRNNTHKPRHHILSKH